MAKSNEFAKGFHLAIDRLLHLGLLLPNFNTGRIVRMDQDPTGAHRPLVSPEDDLDMDQVGAEEFWPLVEPELESEDGEAPPPPRTEPREYYPGWVPRLLGSINIQSQGSSKNFSALHDRLRQLSRTVCWSPHSTALREEQLREQEEKDAGERENTADDSVDAQRTIEECFSESSAPEPRSEESTSEEHAEEDVEV